MCCQITFARPRLPEASGLEKLTMTDPTPPPFTLTIQFKMQFHVGHLVHLADQIYYSGLFQAFVVLLYLHTRRKCSVQKCKQHKVTKRQLVQCSMLLWFTSQIKQCIVFHWTAQCIACTRAQCITLYWARLVWVSVLFAMHNTVVLHWEYTALHFCILVTFHCILNCTQM